jgi:hypothetical protein
MLHTETTWLTSPASTKYHLNIEGGLLQHSVGVAETLLRIKISVTNHVSSLGCSTMWERWGCWTSRIMSLR